MAESSVGRIDQVEKKHAYKEVCKNLTLVSQRSLDRIPKLAGESRPNVFAELFEECMSRLYSLQHENSRSWYCCETLANRLASHWPKDPYVF